MRYEWDKNKNKVNVQKHGIDFEDVKDVFNSPMLLQIDNREEYDEERWIGIGLMKQLVTVVIYIERDEDMIRIISARKATKYEQKRYTNGLEALRDNE